MDYIQYFKESFLGSADSVLSLAKIIIPLMIVMEVLKDLNILDKLTKIFAPMTKLLGLSSKATFPLIVGLFLGLSYGAGIIIKSAKDYKLSKKDLYLIIIFLILCHAVIEDTLIFSAIGANGWMLLAIRLAIAMILTAFSAKCIDKIVRKNKNFM